MNAFTETQLYLLHLHMHVRAAQPLNTRVCSLSTDMLIIIRLKLKLKNILIFCGAPRCRHVMQDAGLVVMPMYRCEPENMRCLTVIGWTFTVLATYAGYVCMLGGVLWGSGILYRFELAWRRSTRQRTTPINHWSA